MTVSFARTSVGKFQGALSGMTAVQLGAVVVRRSGIDGTSVEECLMGCVLPAGLLPEAVVAVGFSRFGGRTVLLR